MWNVYLPDPVSRGSAFNCGVQGGSNFWDSGWNPAVYTSGFHSNESCWAVLCCGVVYYLVNVSYNFWVSGQIPEMLGHSNESSSGIRLHGTSLCPFLYQTKFETFLSGRLWWPLGVQGLTTITYRRIQNFLQSFLDFFHVVYVHSLNEGLSNKHLRIRILGCNLFMRKNSLNSISKTNWKHWRKVDWVRYLHYH